MIPEGFGGGYIVVGVEEKNGLPVRPVKGIDIDKIEPIEKDMIGFNNFIKPSYYPKTSIEEIDGKKVFVIWAHGGLNRPYEVPECVTAKGFKELREQMNLVAGPSKPYIRATAH